MSKLTDEQLQQLLDLFDFSNANKEITGDNLRQFLQNWKDSFSSGLLNSGESIEAAILALQNTPPGSGITFSDQFTVDGQNVSLNIDLAQAMVLVDVWSEAFFSFARDTNVFKSYTVVDREHVFTYDAYSTTGGIAPPPCLGIAPDVAIKLFDLTPSFVSSGSFNISFQIYTPTLPLNATGLYINAQQSAPVKDGNKIKPFNTNVLWQTFSFNLNTCSVPINPLTLIEFYFTKSTGSNFQTVEDDTLTIRNITVSKI